MSTLVICTRGLREFVQPHVCEVVRPPTNLELAVQEFLRPHLRRQLIQRCVERRVGR